MHGSSTFEQVFKSRNLDNEKALVTGATSGIGRAIAVQLAREGADVIVHGRDAQRGAEVVQEIRSADGKARFIAADLTSAADVRRLAADVAAVDILINSLYRAGSRPALGSWLYPCC